DELTRTIEGGDVQREGRTLLGGLSSRTNSAGISALDTIVRRCGYRVVAVPVRGCLHLKTACTALPDGRLLVNPAWLDVRDLGDYELTPVPDDEPWGANVALVGTSVCASAAHVRTADSIREEGFDVQLVDLSEFAKAEGGVTCLSLVFDS
ncbi:MAG: dimethylargininase, partial [Planctomycetes bacterium]|nr:dimethylargininase [Planctomycetota bacterium]